MDAGQVLTVFRKFVKERDLDIPPEALPERPVGEVLEASMDLVEFVMFLEQELDLEDEIDLQEIGPRMAAGEMTFAELAAEVANFLEQR